MTEEATERMIRFEIDRQAVDNIHNDLASASHYLTKRIAERDAAGDRCGIALEMMAGLTMTAFWVEAGINYLGTTKVKGWVERAPGKEKLKRVLAELGLVPDFNARPWSVVVQLKDFRDTLAHGKPETLATEEIVVKPFGFADRPEQLESEWVKSLTVANVVDCYDDTNAVWLEMLKSAGITDIEATSSDSSGITYLREA